MKNIKISNLDATDNNLFDESEIHLQDLTDTEIKETNGGMPRFGCVLVSEPIEGPIDVDPLYEKW